MVSLLSAGKQLGCRHDFSVSCRPAASCRLSSQNVRSTLDWFHLVALIFLQLGAWSPCMCRLQLHW